jgi:hypothetical protein
MYECKLRHPYKAALTLRLEKIMSNAPHTIKVSRIVNTNQAIIESEKEGKGL